jgi:hypothetical protein
VPFLLTAEEARNPFFAAQDFDWTMHDDLEREQRHRLERNFMIKASLQRGQTISYRSSGWSLYPRVHSNDLCTFKPVRSTREVEEGDIVFCEVQPGNRFYSHSVLTKYVGQGEWQFEIGNKRGRSNGWCKMEQIYGKLTDVQH